MQLGWVRSSRKRWGVASPHRGLTSEPGARCPLTWPRGLVGSHSLLSSQWDVVTLGSKQENLRLLLQQTVGNGDVGEKGKWGTAGGAEPAGSRGDGP